jgi:hypothetical protein
LSRCSSKFCIISSKELPLGAPEALKTQAHAEQPKPRKRLFSIQMSFLLAAIIGGRQDCGCGCFVSFFPLMSLWSAESSMHAGGPPHEIRATACFDTPPGNIHAEKVSLSACTFGRKRAYTADNQIGTLAQTLRRQCSAAAFQALVCTENELLTKFGKQSHSALVLRTDHPLSRGPERIPARAQIPRFARPDVRPPNRSETSW